MSFIVLCVINESCALWCFLHPKVGWHSKGSWLVAPYDHSGSFTNFLLFERQTGREEDGEEGLIENKRVDREGEELIENRRVDREGVGLIENKMVDREGEGLIENKRVDREQES